VSAVLRAECDTSTRIAEVATSLYGGSCSSCRSPGDDDEKFAVKQNYARERSSSGNVCLPARRPSQMHHPTCKACYYHVLALRCAHMLRNDVLNALCWSSMLDLL
jgi:hypothetical protein